MKKVFLWFRSARGATAIEYSLIVAGIAVVISVAVFSTGGSLAGAFTYIEHTVASVASTTQ